ncbi:MAG: C25 family cysteine peptidase [Candidatus Cloacimonadota bacterium]
MKLKVCALVLLLILASFSLIAANGSNPVNIRSLNSNRMLVTLQTPSLERVSESISGLNYDRLSLDGAELSAEDGEPELPVYTSLIAIPHSGSYTVNVNPGSYRELSGVRPYPVIPDEMEAASFELNRNVYEGSSLYPSRLVSYTQPMIIRDFRVMQISLSPLQWDPQTNTLRIYDEMEVSIEFNSESSINELPAYNGYSSVWENLYESIISNFNDYRLEANVFKHSRILLIHGNSTDATFQAQLNQFVTWKRQKGHEVNVVSTAVTGTNTTAIKSYIQTQYNNLETRPDYIILLGDTNGSYAIPTFTESYSSYGGKGDYPYTHLVGNDTLGDIFIGRISAENLSQVIVLFNKIYAYERDVNLDPTAASWLNRVVLVGDPSSSGISTQYVNKFIKEMAQQVNPNYSFIENYSGGYSSTMNSALTLGVGFFNYRGYIGMSGWDPPSNPTNGVKMPHATILTCSTGNFENSTATTEAFMRSGTAAIPGGAITATGMSTSGTHTMFNNTLNGGIYDGLLTHHMRTMGEAILNGKLYLASAYNATNPTQVNYFAHWCNLMGDPTVEVFVGIPGSLTMVAESTLPAGTPIYDVYITNAEGMPVEGVSITIWSELGTEIVAKGFTDSEGFCSLFLPTSLTGSCIVTASRHDYKPIQQNMTIDPDGALVYFDKVVVDNGTEGSTGNGDGVANAGETVALRVSLNNTTANAHSGLTAILSTTDPAINITQASSTYPALAPANSGQNETAFLFTVDNNVEPQHDTRFILSLTDQDNNQYQAIFHLGSVNAGLDFGSYTLSSGGNAVMDPAESGILQVTVTNTMSFGATEIWGHLRSLNDLVQVTDSLSFFGNVMAGGSAGSVDGYGLFARAALIPGMQIPFSLRLYNDQGFEQTVSFHIPVGTPSQNTPLGPDEYGYFIYDETDTAYPDCPTYEWIEIHPSMGGSGTAITGYNDNHDSYDEGDPNGSQSIKTVDLPFTFKFYGVDYDQISVCSNGFIAMGVSANGEFRNYRLPGAMGPSPMIAPFWDDMAMIGDASILKHYDETQHTFIIEYYKMRNGFNTSSLETFQVIFYDPLFYPTGLGDGKIKIQYQTFNNVDTGGGGYTPVHGNYSTIGIKDHTNTRGLEYSYNNTYPTTAAALSNQKALMITTLPVLHQNAHLVIGEVILNDQNMDGLVEPGETLELGVKLNNIGMNTATEVSLVGAISNPYVTVVNNQSTYSNIEGSGSGINISPIELLISENCPDDHVVSLICNVSTSLNSWQYPISFTVQKPVISISKVFLNDLEGNVNGLAEPGETIKLVVNYQNNSDVNARNLTSYLTCLDANVTLIDTDVLIPEVPAGKTVQAVYALTLGPNVQIGNFITFYLTFLGELINAQNHQIMLSVGSTGMSEDFEGDNGSFYATPEAGGWEWGGSSYAGAHSGVAVWGTRLNSNYLPNQNLTLVSPDIYIGQNYVLEFWHRYAFESMYDGGNVKISTNNGSTWTLLQPEGGYPASNVVALGEPGFSSTLPSWSLARFSLSAYSNQNVRFKWTMASDQGLENEGWFIDDVQTNGFIDFACLASGTITSGNADAELDKFKVLASNNTLVNANEEGNYSIYLPSGDYTLTALCEGYNSQDSPSFTLNLDSPSYVQNFDLGYFTPITNPGFTFVGAQLILSWDAPEPGAYTLQGYNLYRRINAGHYEHLGVIPEPVYSEEIVQNGTYSYYIEAKYDQGNSAPSQLVNFDYPAVDNDDPSNPVVTTLFNNYPNPFNPETTIRFSLAQPGSARLTIYNMRGQVVKTLVNSQLSSGQHSFVWNGRDEAGTGVASGVYFYRLQTADKNIVKKAMLVK